MQQSYNKLFQPKWNRRCSDSAGSRTHQAIAALICDQPDKNPYTAILSTGTHHNDAERCGSTSACDGHAVSVIYEAAPDYFNQEMINLNENASDSIFEFISSQDTTLGFRLKDDVKFHLFVTKPPCGFIVNQEDACMEWKIPFVDFPHVPKCSSRILIGSKLGIQGYTSHLIENPILIESITILCSNDEECPRIDFGNEFLLPKIKVLEYDPADFHRDFRSSKAKIKYASNISSDTIDNVGQNETATLINTSQGDAKDSAVVYTSLNANVEAPFLVFNPRKDEITSSVLPIKAKAVGNCLKVCEHLEIKRKHNMKLLYMELMDDLKIKEAMVKLKMTLVGKLDKKTKKMKEIIDFISRENEKAVHRLDTSDMTVETWKCIQNEYIGPNHANLVEQGIKKILLQKMITCVDNILSDKYADIVMDCSWHDYINAVPSSYQTTDHEQ